VILANIILGGNVLLFGRRLFWAFVAIAGFLVGVDVAAIVLAAEPVWMQILAGVGLGVLGGFVAVVAQCLGFYAAGSLSTVVWTFLSRRLGAAGQAVARELLKRETLAPPHLIVC
jgi:hypothetical protein